MALNPLKVPGGSAVMLFQVWPITCQELWSDSPIISQWSFYYIDRAIMWGEGICWKTEQGDNYDKKEKQDEWKTVII